MTKRIFAKFTSGLKFGAMAMIVAGGVVIAQPVAAQSNEIAAMQNQMNSLRQAIKDLQLKVYKGQDPEKIDLLSGGDNPTKAQVSQVQAKILELEESLRDLTGQYEVLDNRARRIENRLDKLIEDIDFRLTALESGTPIGATTGAAVTTANDPAVVGQATTVVSSTGATTTASPTISNQEGVLGTLSEQQLQNFQNNTPVQQDGELANSSQTTGGSITTTEALPETEGSGVISVTPRFDTPEAEYKAAYGLLQKHDWDGAERAMKGFIDHYPDHSLVGNAMYWLGETHYARKQYGEAMSSFAATYQHNEKGRKAPDSLLKLGMSLAQLGEVDQSCVTYDILLTKHSDANQVVLRKAQQRKEAQNCPAQ
ncbi:tol-pal system protein YbgF [Curvivirga sp.]|uniref:tol-pal system protein YbgF n=1 Tax=Curvivirga sp. TaxID=2856848 RepID=UPI003B5BAD0F